MKALVQVMVKSGTQTEKQSEAQTEKQTEEKSTTKETYAETEYTKTENTETEDSTSETNNDDLYDPDLADGVAREYISYIGSVAEFKKHFFALALRNGYERYSETVILSDGATWIRSVKDELFPDAQQILDFLHLCEITYGFAKAIWGQDEGKYRP